MKKWTYTYYEYQLNVFFVICQSKTFHASPHRCKEQFLSDKRYCIQLEIREKVLPTLQSQPKHVSLPKLKQYSPFQSILIHFSPFPRVILIHKSISLLIYESLLLLILGWSFQLFCYIYFTFVTTYLKILVQFLSSGYTFLLLCDHTIKNTCHFIK